MCQGNDLDVASLYFHRKLGAFIKNERFYQNFLLSCSIINYNKISKKWCQQP